MKAKFSIRYKFLLVMTLLLVLCVCAYLYLATRTFKQDKTQLVFDLNRSLVTNLAADIESRFRSISDKLELYAHLTYNQPSNSQMISDLLNKENGLAYVVLGQTDLSIMQAPYVRETMLETYGIVEDYFTSDLLAERPIPIERIQQQGEAIWNASLPNGPPLIGFGRSVIIEGESGIPVSYKVVIAYVKADPFLQAISGVQLNEVFVVNGSGEVLVHPEVKAMTQTRSIAGSDILKKVEESGIRTSVVSYVSEGKKMLGAFAKSYQGDILVLSRTPVSRVFASIARLLKRSLLFALIVFTLAFIVALLFSQRLTSPLQDLMGGMHKVAEGDLNTQIKVQSHDEIAVLAGSFNSMIREIKDSRHKLEEINRDLEDKVKARTRELEEQNQAVKNTQEALLKTSRLAAVGEIAGRAAHEVLNPLTSILTRARRVRQRIDHEIKPDVEFIEQLQGDWHKDYQTGGFDQLVKVWQQPSKVDADKLLWQEDMDNLKAVKEHWDQEISNLHSDIQFLIGEGERISRIVQNMRSLTHIRGDRRVHSTHRLLHNSVNIMADLFNQNEINIKESYEAQQDNILVDQDEFIQSVTNMLRNSLQAIKSRSQEEYSGKVVIRTQNDGKMIFIDLQDNGAGIDPDIQKKLFDSQFSTKNPEEGTGLGLSISRRFMRGYGGDIILLHSKVGEGTTFRVSLPLDEDKEVAA